jgi:atypical dual specificity phosphatase
MQRFYWVIDEVLAGCSLPGGSERGGRRGTVDAAEMRAALESDLALLQRKGIQAVLTLTESSLADDVLASSGLTYLHIPVLDLHAPTPAQLQQAIAFIDAQSARGHATAVHCLMGQGRTGTVLAAYLIRNGLTAQEALDEIRRRCDGAISAQEQEDALHLFAGSRAWVV